MSQLQLQKNKNKKRQINKKLKEKQKNEQILQNTNYKKHTQSYTNTHTVVS